MGRNYFMRSQAIASACILAFGTFCLCAAKTSMSLTNAYHIGAVGCIAIGLICMLFVNRMPVLSEKLEPALKKMGIAYLLTAAAFAIAFECTPVFSAHLFVQALMLGVAAFALSVVADDFTQGGREIYRASLKDSGDFRGAILHLMSLAMFPLIVPFFATGNFIEPFWMTPVGDIFLVLIGAAIFAIQLIWATKIDCESAYPAAASNVAEFNRKVA